MSTVTPSSPWRASKRARLTALAIATGSSLLWLSTQATSTSDATDSNPSNQPPTSSAGYSALELEKDLSDPDDDYDYRDVSCMTTSKTLPNGDGWYVCSWRTPGSPTSLVSTVEVGVTSFNWSYTGLRGPVSRFTPKQRDQILVDPTAYDLWQVAE